MSQMSDSENTHVKQPFYEAKSRNGFHKGYNLSRSLGVGAWSNAQLYHLAVNVVK